MRTRFPPSPTGLLHIGALRTALYNYLIAKQSGGQFLLRIEDTDQSRQVEGAVEDFLHVLHWAGIDPDEGVMKRDKFVVQEGAHGPYVQSERFALYKEHAQQLLDAGHAYYAFDTAGELDQMRQQEKQAGNPAPKYDASVRMRMKNALTLSEEEVNERLERGDEYVIRMRIPEGNVISFDDEIRGRVEFKGLEIDDQILVKSDGFPTYHLANVVDDHLMDINLVIRGEEWLSSTPKHLLLYEYFGWTAPQFAHVPLLLNPGGGKLSKRQGDVAVSDYIDKGYLPAAIINFIALLGWNPGTTQEIFSLEELIEQFSLERIQKGGAVFDTERLDWFQGQWVRQMSPEKFAEWIKSYVSETHPAAGEDRHFADKATLIQDRITFPTEAPEMLSYYYSEPTVTMELLANAKQKLTPKMIPDILDLLEKTLEPVLSDEWTEDTLKDLLFKTAEDNDLKKGQLLWPLRAALTGLPFSPGAFEVAAVLGRGTTLSRLAQAKVVIAG